MQDCLVNLTLLKISSRKVTVIMLANYPTMIFARIPKAADRKLIKVLLCKGTVFFFSKGIYNLLGKRKIRECSFQLFQKNLVKGIILVVVQLASKVVGAKK